jgi:hypothetical protein
MLMRFQSKGSPLFYHILIQEGMADKWQTFDILKTTNKPGASGSFL